MNPWDLIKHQLQAALSAESYQNWVSQTSFEHLDGGVLRVLVPNVESKAWLETEYADQVSAIIRRLNLRVQAVLYEPVKATAVSATAESDRSWEPESPASQLNPRFTFETFVVGSCNQFAHAAARSVATNPSRSYNPLFIYGGTGMGKTHLMHAIGRALMSNSAGMRMLYTSSERFTNEVVTGIRLERMPQLRQRYRSADVLLIDDIQLHREQRTHAGRVLSHLQRAARRPEADRDLERFASQGDSRPGGAPAFPFRVGTDWPISSRRISKPRWPSSTRRPSSKA